MMSAKSCFPKVGSECARWQYVLQSLFHIAAVAETPRHVLVAVCRCIPSLFAGSDGKLLNDPSAAGVAELSELKDSLADTQPAGALVGACPWHTAASCCSSRPLVLAATATAGKDHVAVTSGIDLISCCGIDL
jgi:hypothetical protein